MGVSKATKFMLMAVYIAVLLLISTEVAAAVFHDFLPDKLGRRLLQGGYNTTGRGGYNTYNTTGRGGYNTYNTTGRGGYNTYNTTGRGGYN